MRLVLDGAGSTARNGRRSALSRRRSAARRRRCGDGCGRRSGTAASGPVRRARSRIASRRWSGRTASCARPMRSCARRRRILPWRSSTARRSRDRVHRRSSGHLRGRADLPGPADRPVHLPRPRRAARRSCPGLGQVAAGRDAAGGGATRPCRELRHLRRAECLAPARPRGDAGGVLHGGAADAAVGLARRGTRERDQDRRCRTRARRLRPIG